jgi:hypothetical protein
MKRSAIIGGLALFTFASLGIATLAMVQRQRADARLAEIDRSGSTALAKRSARSITATDDGRAGIPSAAASAAVAVKGDERGKASARPDVGALLAAHPELQVAYQRAANGRLHQTYDRLFVRLGLSAAQIDQAVALLGRDGEQELDLAMAAQTLELAKDDPTLRQFRSSERSDTESQLEALLGAQGMQAWRDYNRALNLRSTAEDVASIAFASDTPMTGAQTEQLMRVLAEANATYRAGGRPEWSSTDWSEVLRRASTFLAPAHVAALEAKVQQARAAALHAQFYASRPRR